MNFDKTTSKFFYSLLLTILLSFLVLSYSIYLVDPLGAKGKPNLIDPTNIKYFMGGILNFSDYSSIIVGSSRAAEFRTSEIEEILELPKVLSASLHGSNYSEISLFLELAEKNPSLENVIWIFDVYIDIDPTLEKEHYYYLYQKKTFKFWLKYLVNYQENLNFTYNALTNSNSYIKPSEIENYLRLDKLETRKQRQDSSIFFDPNWPALPWIENYIRGKEYPDRNNLEEIVLEALNKNLIPLINRNPEKKFYLIIPPTPLINWLSYSTEDNFKMRTLIATALSPYENVYLYDFSTDWDIVSPLNYYLDHTHPLKFMSTYMLKKIKEEENRITPKTLEKYEKHLSLFTKKYKSYNFIEALNNYKVPLNMEYNPLK